MRINLRDELQRRLRKGNVGDILRSQAQRRIETKGADVGGYARLWADTATMKVWKGRGKNRRQVLLRHPRRGGTPLYDTGQTIYNNLKGHTKYTDDGVQMSLTGPLIAIFQHHGFTTRGPNFIPFSKAMSRGDPKAKKRGEYVWAKNGVTVPSRPILAVPKSARLEIARAIADALGAR